MSEFAGKVALVTGGACSPHGGRDRRPLGPPQRTIAVGENGSAARPVAPGGPGC